jgi:hypothetical protein
MSARENIFTSMRNASRNYNKSISDLLSCIVAKSKGNSEIVAINEKFSAIKNMDPDVIVMTSGPYLWKYRKEIVEKNQDFFLAKSFEDDIAEAKKEKQERFGSTDMQGIINLIKTFWKSMNPQEKEICWNHIQSCIRNYASYVGCSKKLKTN